MLHFPRWQDRPHPAGRPGGLHRDPAELLPARDGRELAELDAEAPDRARPRPAGRRLSSLRGRPDRLRRSATAHAAQRRPQRDARASRASATPASPSRAHGVQLRIRDPGQIDDARTRLEALRNPLVGIAARRLERQRVRPRRSAPTGSSGFTYSPSRARRSASAASSSSRSRSSAAASTNSAPTEPSIQRQGDDRILVEAPGLGDPARLKAIVGQTAQLTFHLVESTITGAADRAARKPGTIVVPDVEQPERLLCPRPMRR